MKSFSKLFFSLLLGLLSAGFLTFLTFPRIPLAEHLLSQRKLYLLSEGAGEEAVKLFWKKGKLFYGEEELLRFDLLTLYLLPRQRLEVLCGGKKLKVDYALGAFRSFYAEGFTCLKGAQKVEGSLEERGGLYGKLSLRGLEAGGFFLEAVELEFEGKRFKGSVKYGNLLLRGGGTLNLDPKNPLKSKVKALFEGGGVRLRVEGTLERLRVLPG